MKSSLRWCFLFSRCLIYKVHVPHAEQSLLYQAQFCLSRTFFRRFRPPSLDSLLFIAAKQLSLLKSNHRVIYHDFIYFSFIVAAFDRIDYGLFTHNFVTSFVKSSLRWCFLFSRCLIYKVHVPHAEQFMIIRIFSPFVNAFFPFSSLSAFLPISTPPSSHFYHPLYL